ncbi:MAG: aldehyde dehydrogenase family protein [Actinobacteria bacterium]|nr:aldehyde dehydrogenase family protein [Actinomycetota bacterium]
MSSVELTVREYGHFIDGEEVAATGQIDRLGPATGELVARFAAGTATDVEAAVSAARRAFDRGPWPRLSGAERARVLLDCVAALHERAEEIAMIDALEVGKPLRQARGDVAGAIGHFEYAAALAQDIHGETFTDLENGRMGFVFREPAGVAALIIPWNFPAGIFGQKAPYALAAGCTVVAKPSELTSGSAVEIARLITEAGVPAGAFNVVTGYGDPVGQALVESPDVDFVSFTGSTATGQRIAAAAAGSHKRIALELGGKSANIVFADADLDDAVDGSLFSVFYNAGECCVAGTRLLVEEAIADEFLDRLARRAGELTVGDPLADDAQVGALISPDHLEKVMSYVASGKEEGARLLTGGAQVDGGLFVEPTIFDGVTPQMRIFREEIFGPVLSAARFEGVEGAVALANDTPYGLGNTVWTKNVDTALSMAKRLRSGSVWVNTSLDTAPQMPFGGFKASGHGREMGRAGFEAFTELKSCYIAIGKRDPYFG